MSVDQGRNGSGEHLSLGLFIYNPVNSAPGSPVLLYAQPLLRGKLAASSVILSGILFILAVINQVFHLENQGIAAPAEDSQVVQLSLAELQEVLSSLKKRMEAIGNKGLGSEDTPEDALIAAIGAWSSYGTGYAAPLLFVSIPFLTFPLVRGSVPLLILETLVTIFVRAVVPPD